MSSMVDTSRRSLMMWLWLLLVVASSHAFAQGPVTYQYFYDPTGQLVRVVDSTGVSIEYVYDDAGNVTQIKRVTGIAPLQLTIFNFTPQLGGIGTTVTIQGQGFSSTPAQNIVSFNGAQATVVSSSSTVLVATVPSGATSGQISVSTGGKTATSS